MEVNESQALKYFNLIVAHVDKLGFVQVQIREGFRIFCITLAEP